MYLKCNDNVESVCISSDGKYLASGGGNFYGKKDYKIIIWSIESGK